MTRKEPLCSPGCGLSSPGGLGDKSADISPALSPTPSAGKSDLLAVGAYLLDLETSPSAAASGFFLQRDSEHFGTFLFKKILRVLLGLLSSTLAC